MFDRNILFHSVKLANHLKMSRIASNRYITNNSLMRIAVAIYYNVAESTLVLLSLVGM